jgi:hypothetical protein
VSAVSGVLPLLPESSTAARCSLGADQCASRLAEPTSGTALMMTDADAPMLEAS